VMCVSVSGELWLPLSESHSLFSLISDGDVCFSFRRALAAPPWKPCSV